MTTAADPSETYRDTIQKSLDVELLSLIGTEALRSEPYETVVGGRVARR